MKNTFLFLIILTSFSGCAVAQKGDCKDKAKSFRHHFKILDSISKATTIDTLSNCQRSIQFMEENTGIEASTDANYFGRFACTKNDLANWHKWYQENCLNKQKKKIDSNR